MLTMLTTPHSNEVLQLGVLGLGTHFGIEIEFEMNSKDKTPSLSDFLFLWDNNKYELEKYFVITYDSSLINGVEIVSKPMTFYYHSLILPKLYQWIKEIENDLALTITNTTGMHIHIDKSGVNNENLEWIINYLQRNEKEIDLLAGRKQNQYCLRMFEDEKYLYSKSSALRISDQTVELRIFSTFYDPENIIQILGIIERILSSN